MAQRDYASRQGGGKKRKSVGLNKTLLLSIAALVVVGFATGLYFLKQQSPDVAASVNSTEKTQPKRQLPSRPEEQWSYIKELESRTVLTDAKQTEQAFRLTEKQKEDLRLLEEKEKQAAAERLKRAEETSQQSENTAAAEPNAAEMAEKAALEKAKREEERKKAELAKKEEQRKQELAKREEAKKEEQRKQELAKREEAKKAEVKKEEVKKVESAKPANTGQFGLQCGAFKNRSQAENLQARLAMSGLNARINASADWNRVVVGPVGDRAAASKAQQQASSITGCVIIGM